MHIPTTSSVRDLTRLFEPNLEEGENTRSESNVSIQSRQSSRAPTSRTASLVCNRQITLTANANDEHLNQSADQSGKLGDKSTSSDQTGSTDTSVTASSGTTDATSEATSTPTKPDMLPSQSDSTPKPHGDGNSSDESSIQHQELQRSPLTAAPPAIRPLGHLGGNMQYFLTTTEFSENGERKVRESKYLLILTIIDEWTKIFTK